MSRIVQQISGTSVEGWTASGPEAAIEPLADGGVLVRPELMQLGVTYPLVLYGVRLLAEKTRDGSIDFWTEDQ